MKNFEKYEKEIKELSKKGDGFVTIIHKLGNITVHTSDEIVEWLYEGYKESLLTDKEREYIKEVIKPFRDYVDGIYLVIGWEPHIGISFTQNDSHWVGTVPNKGFSFVRLDTNRKYTLEELGL